MQQETVNIRIDDDTLIQQCRRGSSEALERLIIRYKDRIYNVILRICGNSEDAAELTQDTFVKIIENLGKFKGISSFYTWAFRIAVNITLNYRTRRNKRQASSLDTVIDGYVQEKKALKDFLAGDESLEPQVIVESRERRKLIFAALKKLDDNHKTIIVLRDIEGMDYTRIAYILDIELGTVKSRLSRARNKLRKILESILQ